MSIGLKVAVKPDLGENSAGGEKMRFSLLQLSQRNSQSRVHGKILVFSKIAFSAPKSMIFKLVPGLTFGSDALQRALFFNDL